MLERFNEVKALEESCENFYGSTPEFLSPNNSGCGTPNGINSPFSPSLSPTSSSGGPSPSPIERKTSLGVACQKFLMLFLIAPEVCKYFLIGIVLYCQNGLNIMKKWKKGASYFFREKNAN